MKPENESMTDNYHDSSKLAKKVRMVVAILTKMIKKVIGISNIQDIY